MQRDWCWRRSARRRDETRRDDALSVGQPDKRLSMNPQQNTKHKASLRQLTTCGTREVPSHQFYMNGRKQDNGVSPLSFDQNHLSVLRRRLQWPRAGILSQDGWGVGRSNTRGGIRSRGSEPAPLRSVFRRHNLTRAASSQREFRTGQEC